MRNVRESATGAAIVATASSISRTGSHSGSLRLPSELITSLQRSESGASGALSPSTVSRTPTPLQLSGEIGSAPPSPRHIVSDASAPARGRHQHQQQERVSEIISPTPSSHGGLLTPKSDTAGAQRSRVMSGATAVVAMPGASPAAGGHNPPRQKTRDVSSNSVGSGPVVAAPPQKPPKRAAPSPRGYGGAGGRRWLGAPGAGSSAPSGSEVARLRALQKQPLFKFMVAVRAMLFLFKLRNRILAVRRDLQREIFVKPRAAFAIQCAFRRMRAKRRWSLAKAAQTILRFLRPRAVRIMRARRHKVILIQRICRAFRARCEVFDQWRQHRQRIVFRVVRRRLQICVAKNTLEHLRAMLEERRLFEQDASNAYRALFRQERQEFTDGIRRAAAASLQAIRNQMQLRAQALQQRVTSTQAVIAAANRAARMSTIYASSPRHSSTSAPSQETAGFAHGFAAEGLPAAGVSALYAAGGGNVGDVGGAIVDFAGSYMIQVLGASFATLKYGDSDQHSPSEYHHHQESVREPPPQSTTVAAAAPTSESQRLPLTDAFNESLSSLAAPQGLNPVLADDHGGGRDDTTALHALTQAIATVTKQMTVLAAVTDAHSPSDAEDNDDATDSGGDGSSRGASPGPFATSRSTDLRLDDGLTLVARTKKRRRGARRSTIAPSPSALFERRRSSAMRGVSDPLSVVHDTHHPRSHAADYSSGDGGGGGAASPVCSSAGSASSPVSGDADGPARHRPPLSLLSVVDDRGRSATPSPANVTSVQPTLGTAAPAASSSGSVPLVGFPAATSAVAPLPLGRKSSASALAAASSSRLSSSSLSATDSAATDTAPKPSPSGTAPRAFSLPSTLPESNSSFSSPLGFFSPSSDITPEGLVGRHDSAGSGVLESHQSSQHWSSNASSALAGGSMPSRTSFGNRSGRRRASRSGQVAAATVITDELGLAYAELLEATEAIERKQLQAQMLSNVRDMHRHVQWCVEVLHIRDCVPRPFISLLPHLAPSWILHLAVALFSDEEVARAAIVEEYESTPLMFLSRPIMGVNSEKRRRRMKELLLQRAAALFEAHVTSQMSSAIASDGGKLRGGRRLSLAASAAASAATNSRNSVSPESSFNGSFNRQSPPSTQSQKLSPTAADRERARRSSIAISLVVTETTADSAGNLSVLPPMHAKSSRGSTVSTHSLGEHRIGLPSSPGRRETMALPTKPVSASVAAQLSPFETSLRGRQFTSSPRNFENSPAVSGEDGASGPMSNSSTPRSGGRRLASFASVVEAAMTASSSPSSRIRGSVFCGGSGDGGLDSPRRQPRPPPSGAFEALRMSLSASGPWLSAAAGGGAGGGAGRNSSSVGSSGGRTASFGSLLVPVGDDMQLLNNSLRRNDDSPSRLVAFHGSRHDADTAVGAADDPLASGGAVGGRTQMWRAPHAPLRGVVSPPTAVLGFPVRPAGREASLSFVNVGGTAAPTAVTPATATAAPPRAQRTKVTFSVAPSSTASSSERPEDDQEEAQEARLPDFIIEVPRSSASGADLMVRRKGSNWA